MTDEEAAQVKLIFAPDWRSEATSIEEIRKRTGTLPMSPEEFDRHLGSRPPTARDRRSARFGSKGSRGSRGCEMPTEHRRIGPKQLMQEQERGLS
jgi:hypothetical protein